MTEGGSSGVVFYIVVGLDAGDVRGTAGVVIDRGEERGTQVMIDR